MGIIDRLRRSFISKTSEDAMADVIKEQRDERIEKRAREISEEEEARKRAEEPARGRGGSLFNFNVDLVKPNKIPFWIWILLLAVLFLSWKYNILGFKDKLLPFGVTIIGLITIALLVLFVLYGFISGLQKEDYARIFIAAAMLIWLLDLVPENFWIIGPFLGVPYGGFEAPLAGTLLLSVASIIMSTTFITLMYINMVLEIIKKEYLSFTLAGIFILAMDYFSRRIIPQTWTYSFTVPYLQYLVYLIVIVLFFVAWWLDRKHRGTALPEFFSSFYMLLVFTFFWLNNGWQGNIRALMHVAFILWFGFGYIKPKENDKVRYRILIPTLLIIDFFGYGLLWTSDLLVLKFIPPLVLFVITYCYIKESNEVEGKRKATYPVVAFILLITFILVMSVNVAGLQQEGNIPFIAKKGTGFKEVYSEFSSRIKALVESNLDTATGGLYRSNIEKNRYESLGVYFSNIRAADPRFYTNEPITVWGTIRSKTYQDAVIINFSCYRWKDGRRISSDRATPNFKFPIFTLEDIDTECIFLPSKQKGKEIASGSNTITFSAEYNFGTDAYIKTYFIDRERARAYTRENIEPLSALGIKDKNPKSVSTNGPVEIGMKAGPLVTVSEGYSIKPTIGISLLNRQEVVDKDKRIISKWDGKIKNITELVLLVPPGVTLTKSDGSPLHDACTSDEIRTGACPCNMPFKEYKQEDCESTCDNQVSEPCINACKSLNTNEESSAVKSCENECKNTVTRCKDECKRLFQPESDESGSGEYKAYALEVGSMEFKDLNKDIDKYRTFQCRYEPSSAVLGSEPYTTRYFRVRTRYNYLLENSVTVNVEAPPEESKTIVPSPIYSIASDKGQPYSDLYFTGLTPEIINGIASVESRFRHCCTDSTRTRSYNCIESGERDCDPRYLITSGTSIGIMQIKYDTPATIAEVNRLAGEVCGELTIYNYDCNVKVGIAILKNKYDAYKDGCQSSSIWTNRDGTDTDGKKMREKYKTFIEGCESGISSRGIRYDSYKGIDAAIRGYNGWGISSNKFDIDYVEKVKRAAQSISGKDIIDPVTLGSITRGGQGMMDPPTSQIEEEQVP